MCKSKGFQTRISQIPPHPIFRIAKNVTPINLIHHSQGIPQWNIASAIRLQDNMANSAVERYVCRIRLHIVSWVRIQQGTINFRDDNNLVELEADECTFGCFPSGKKDQPVAWIGYVGLARRGHADTKGLQPLPFRNARQRAPGLGPTASG